MDDVPVDSGLMRGATVRLRGHQSRAAHLDIVSYPVWAWVCRLLALSVLWLGSTALTLLVTFDPFVASFPFVIGLGFVYRAWNARYRVNSFRGHCPRCENELTIRPGSKIDLPHPLVCYSCHHEPELAA
jgi:hypothetical protein